MKVYFVTREGYRMAGARVRCYNFARMLAERGVRTEVISYADDFGAKSGEREREMGLREKVRLNLRALKRLRGAGKHDVIVSQRLNYHTAAPFFRSLNGARFVFDCDDWNIRENPVYHFGFYPSSKAEFLTRRIAANASACVGASHYLCDYLRRFNANTVYIPTGADTRLFAPAPARQGAEVVISWTGTVYHPEMRENLFFLLECFREVARKDGNVRLEIAGEGAYLPDIGRRAAELGMGDKVRLANWVAPDAMGTYLDRVDIGVVPLIQNTRFNNAKSPTKLFEYMAKAKPVVASPTGETTRIIRHGIDGFIAAGKEDYIAALARLCSDAGLRRAVGHNARSTVENAYSLEVCGRRLFELIISR